MESRVCVANKGDTENDIEEQLRKDVESNRDIIENPKKPPEARLVPHVINTGNCQPVRSKIRRLPPKWIDEIESQIKEMLDNGICRPSNSPWSSQVLLVRKKDNSMRFVIDYRKVNDCTTRDEYPMPNIKDLLEEVAGSKFFSCMDLPSAYWHIPMHEDSIEKTAFEIPKGKFEMLRMPYGLKNSQATQQRHMDQTLKDVKNTSAYVDNILSHAVLFGDHINNIRSCFKNLRLNNLSLRLDKCKFGKRKIEQFGLIVSEIGMSPSSENIKKIKEYPRPGNAKELKRFLGLANYYRDFVQMFAGIVEPLYELPRKGSSFI